MFIKSNIRMTTDVCKALLQSVHTTSSDQSFGSESLLMPLMLACARIQGGVSRDLCITKSVGRA